MPRSARYVQETSGLRLTKALFRGPSADMRVPDALSLNATRSSRSRTFGGSRRGTNVGTSGVKAMDARGHGQGCPYKKAKVDSLCFE